jgi:O-antigen ligase
MIALLIPSFFIIRSNQLNLKSLKEWRSTLLQFFKQRNYFFITLIFGVYLLSGLNSKDTDTWLFFTLMKLPFLLFTIAMFNLPGFTRQNYFRLLMVFILILLGSTFGILPEFFSGVENLNELILKGHSIPTPVDHIKYSLFISFGIIVGLIILFSKERLFFHWEKPVIAIILVYLVIFIHLMAVRSGIIILYVNLAVFVFYRLLSIKRYMAGLFAIGLILALPVMAYFTMPTFRAKIEYSSEDFQMATRNRQMAFSDGERLRSYKVGWELFESSPITGVGIGDIRKSYEDLYTLRFFSKNPTFLPHNQFLTIAVASGVVGLIFFSLGFFLPFFYNGAWKDPFLKALFILMLLSFMVENTLERQYSVAFYLVFLLLGLNQQPKK